MGRRGQFKYICEECKADNWLSAKERGSRFRPKCIECGSTWLEPSSRSKASERLSVGRAAADEKISLQKRKMGIK